jgi:hypothetical protein
MTTESGEEDKASIGHETPPLASATDAPSDLPRPEPTPGHPTVWTASDARGPLETAEAADALALDEGDIPVAHTQRSDEAPATAPPASAPTAPLPSPRPSRWPIAAAVLIGAAIGAGSATLAGSPLGQSWLGATAPMVPTGPDPKLTGLVSRVEALEARPASPAASVDGLKAAIADLDGRLTSLQKSIGAAPPPQTVDLAPLEQKVAALQSSLDALKAQGGTNQGARDDLEAKLAALQAEVAAGKQDRVTTQASVASVAGEQKLLAGKVVPPALAVVADSLVQQIDQGQPYVAQVDALAALGADPAKVAVLRQNADTGVASAKMLAAKFEPLAEPIGASARKAPPNAGLVERLKSDMFSMVSIRRVDDTSGTDLPSRVARIKTALAHDDIADAVATWDALPADARARGEAWRTLAKASATAMAAARALQSDAILALGAKKS